MTTYQMKLQEIPFQRIVEGTKTIELRLNDEKRAKLQPGDHILFSCVTDPERTVEVRVTALHRFDSFQILYLLLPLTQMGYTPEEAKTASAADMNAYYTPEQQAKYGALGIQIELV